MAEIVNLADRRPAGRSVQPAPGPAEELEHVGTAGDVRVSVARQPDADPGWMHVVVSRGIDTPITGVFPVPMSVTGRDTARIVGKAVLRALRAAQAGEGGPEAEMCLPEEVGLHEAVRRAEERRRSQEGSPDA